MSKKSVQASGPSLEQKPQAVKDKIFVYEKGLMKLTQATDVNMIESCRQAVTDLTRHQKAATLLSSIADTLPTSLMRRLLYLAIPATANCIRIIMQQTQSSLFKVSAADKPTADILPTLYHDLVYMFIRLSNEASQPPVLSRMKEAGLIPAFVDYSQAAIKALERLAAEDTCCTTQQQPDAKQQQQQQQLNDEVVNVGAAMHGVYKLWTCLFSNAHGSKGLEDELLVAAPTVVHLAVSSVPLLQKALSICSDYSSSSSSRSSSSSNNNKADWKAVYLQDLCALRDRAQELAVFITFVMVKAQGANSSEVINQQRQQRQRSKQSKKQLVEQRKPLHLSPDHAMRLLLLTLTRQAERLHRSSPAGCSTSQQQQSAKHHAILNSHTALLVELGFPTAPAAATAGHHASSSFPRNLNAPAAVTATVDVVCLSTLFLLQDVIVHCSKTGSSTRNINSTDIQTCFDEQQQQQQRTRQSQLPHHLLLPGSKLLVEIMLLLPADELSCRAVTLKAILLLLQAAQAAENLPALSTTPAAVAAAAAAAGSGVVPWAPLLAGTAAARRSVTEAEVGPWDLTLPVTTAAGLLVPVMQLMSTVVIHSLKTTETQWQQQEQHYWQQKVAAGGPVAGSSSSSTMPVEAARAVLLRRFGNLLMIVCKPVEAKHIAAALKHDPVIPLIAVEAVIRTQACRLMADGWSPQHGLQQVAETQTSAASSNASSQPAAASSSDNAEGADIDTIVLLKFVSSVLVALHMLVDSVWNPLPKATYITSREVPDLLLRIFTVITSACKTYQAAAADTRQQLESQHPSALQTQHRPGWQGAAAVGHLCNVLVTSLAECINSKFTHQLSNVCWLLHLCHFVNIKVMDGHAAKISVVKQGGQQSSALDSTTETASTSADQSPVCLEVFAAADVQRCLAVLQEQYEEQKHILADHSFSCPVLPWCCNNPSCSNLSRLSEFQLVSGKACVCGGCEVARYCSKGCQQQHWKQHKGNCHKLAKDQSSLRAP